VSESGHLTLSFTRVHFVSAFRYACARIRVSVRPFVFAFVTRALVHGRIAGSSHEKKRAEREEKKEKKKKRGKPRARSCESVKENERTRRRKRKRKERREDKRANAGARKRTTGCERLPWLAYIKAKVIISVPVSPLIFPLSPSVFSFARSLRLAASRWGSCGRKGKRDRWSEKEKERGRDDRRVPLIGA